MKKALLSFVGVLLLAGCKPTTATQVCSEEYSNQSATAKEYVQKIIDGNYEEAAKYMHSTEMQQLITDKKYVDSITAQLDVVGTLKEIGTPLCENTKDGLAVSLPMKFSNQNVNLNIIFDENSAISGVSFTEYSGK